MKLTEGALFFLLGTLLIFWFPGVTAPAGYTADTVPLAAGSSGLWMWKALALGFIVLFWGSEILLPSHHFIRRVILVLFAGWVIIVPAANEIILRQLTQTHYYAHDGGVLQTEAATAALLVGDNPYQIDYRASSLGKFSGYANFSENPALTHLVYLPSSFLLQVPLVVAARAVGIPFDARYLYLFAFLVVLAALLVPRRELFAAIIWIANPLLSYFLIRGTNDYLLLSLLIGGVLCLAGKRWVLGGILLGLACSVKQFAWFFLPFLWVYLRTQPTGIRRRVLQAGLCCWVLMVIPFVLWSPFDFIDDVIAYPLGLSEISYPVEAVGSFGSGTLVRQAPTWLRTVLAPIKIVILILLAGLLLCRQARDNRLGPALLHTAFLLLTAGYLGPILHDNYLGVFMLLALFGLTRFERCATILADADEAKD